MPHTARQEVLQMTRREQQILAWIAENPLISQQELADRAGITRSSMAVHISNLTKKGYISGRGYILHTAPYVVVIGGANMDIGGIAYAPLVSGDSNPGRVRTSPGGVGRNIAHNLCLLGTDTRLITAFGDDDNGRRLTAFCGEPGIDISRSLTIHGAATSTYLFISGPDGDMAVGLNDMEIYSHITPQYLSSLSGFLNGAQLVVTDTNIPAESLHWLAENCTAPLFADPVSTAKAEKLRPVLGRLHTLKPNRLEAELLSGTAITDEGSLCRAADVLLQTGLQRVFISLGAGGVFAADHRQYGHIPCGPAEVVNTTGCGDALMAAIVRATLDGQDLGETARTGLAAAAITMQSAETISADLNMAALQRRLEQIPAAVLQDRQVPRDGIL